MKLSILIMIAILAIWTADASLQNNMSNIMEKVTDKEEQRTNLLEIFQIHEDDDIDERRHNQNKKQNKKKKQKKCLKRFQKCQRKARSTKEKGGKAGVPGNAPCEGKCKIALCRHCQYAMGYLMANALIVGPSFGTFEEAVGMVTMNLRLMCDEGQNIFGGKCYGYTYTFNYAITKALWKGTEHHMVCAKALGICTLEGEASLLTSAGFYK